MKDRKGVTLKVGQICKVHPTPTSQSKRAYNVQIVKSTFDKGELMTMKDYPARINEYLRKRLEIIS